VDGCAPLLTAARNCSNDHDAPQKTFSSSRVFLECMWAHARSFSRKMVERVMAGVDVFLSRF